MSPLTRPEFQRILFQTAFCLMACDGHIDDREVNEIREMDRSATFFKGIELSDELDDLLKNLKAKGKDIVDDLFDTLIKLNLSTVQELLVLEVALRLIYADEKIEENEIKYLRALRSKLIVPDQIVRERFGEINILFDRDYTSEVIKAETHRDLLENISIPEAKVIEGIDFSKMR